MRTQISTMMKGTFFRNVSTVISGTVLAQAVTYLAVPILTRLYTPSVYGIQSILMTSIALFGVVASFGYPAAIVLPDTDREAHVLVRLSVLLALVMSVVCELLLIFLGDTILALLGMEAARPLMHLIPVVMFISAMTLIFIQWIIRKRQFGPLAKVTVAGSVILNGCKVGFGFFQPTAIALILANVVGIVASFGLGLSQWFKTRARPEPEDDASEMPTMGAIALKYYDFAALRTPQALINSLSQFIPIFLLAAYVGVSASGQYAVAIALLNAPSLLIGKSISDVMYPKINDALKTGQDIRKLLIKSTLFMAAVGCLPFLFVIAFGPPLFQLVFGENWRLAGEYGQWLAIWCFLQYLNKPSVAAIPVLRLQGKVLLYEIFSTGSKLLALWIGFTMFRNDVYAVALFSIAGSIAYIWLIWWVIANSETARVHKRLRG